MSLSSSSSSRGRRLTSEIQIPKKWTDRETSPERTKVWAEPKPKTPRKVSVVYYLSRNGQLEHPHFMEVALSSPHGLYLKDVINRLNSLRGKAMASMYSWSYKHGFVWHDLLENDFIYPTQGQDYILKGSEIVDHAAAAASMVNKLEEESDSPVVITRRRNQSWSSIDLNEYRVYKSESFGDSAGKLGADAATQTEDKRRRRKAVKEEEDGEIQEKNGIEAEMDGERVPHVSFDDNNNNNRVTELSREEISPPPSDSSPETLETLMKADGRLGLRTSESEKGNRRLRCGANSEKDQGFSLVGHYRSRMPRGAGNHAGKETATGTSMEIPDLSGVRLEDKEYFSGSLIETKKVDIPALKRSSSYNADSGSRLQMIEHEGEVVRTKCIPRKSKTLQTKKEEGASPHITGSGQHGSKRFDAQQ
ncbi:hypothetical protein Fmac_022145 [Flemingia macrophylla]|uniref:SOSEKI DIX-like domain-containing protein n=1 Tax=Flemingia macrophylla TaxID=520843 RepID=A0ABD1LYW4_9FABA